MLYNFPRQILHSKAPGRNNPKCPDCKHDVRLQHHTPFGNTLLPQYQLGLCVKCSRNIDKTEMIICPSVWEFFTIRDRIRKTFEEEWKEFIDENK